MNISPIQSLWIGKSLSALECLSINSFLKHGHEFHLYCFEEVANIPPGVTVKEARHILPPEKIFKYREYDSYAGFSNLFRYKLLLEKGGYWADLDVVCLRPFDTEDDYVFPSERTMDINGYTICNCIIKAPPASAIMEYCFTTAASCDPNLLKWGETGPGLVMSAVERFELHAFVSSPDVYCPVDFWSWRQLFVEENENSMDSMILPNTKAIHFWNEMLRRENVNKNGEFPPDCVFEQLKLRYPLSHNTRNG